MPKQIFIGLVRNRLVVVEQAMLGRVLTHDELQIGVRANRAALVAIRSLHEVSRESGKATLAGDECALLIEKRLHPSLAIFKTADREEEHARILAGLIQELCVSPWVATITHGDFWGENVLFEGDPIDPSVSSVIDWETWQELSLPEEDILTWLAYAHPERMAGFVRDSLLNPAGLELQIQDYYGDRPNLSLAIDALVVFTWMKFLADPAARKEARLNRRPRNLPDFLPTLATVLSHWRVLN